MLQQAINHYHSLLDTTAAAQAQRQIDERLRAEQLFFGDRPLTTVLRPRLLSPAQYARMQRGCSLIAAASRTLADQMLADDALRQRIALTPLEEALVARDPGYREPSAHGRMDTFLTVDGASFQFVEYNAESPAAIAFQDALAALFLDLDLMAAFRQAYTVRDLPGKPQMLATVRRVWNEFAGSDSNLAIAIVDWDGLPTKTEFTLFQRYFEEHGIPTVICTPDDFAYADGILAVVDRVGRSAPRPVTMIYKRVLISELLTHYGADFVAHPLARAYTDGKICMLNSFRNKLMHKKMIFGLLSDPSLAPLFSAEQQAAIAEHIPWTRRVAAGTTSYQGEQVDLLPFINTNRERFLLKPNDEYGGKGIIVGWECSDAAWAAGMAEAERTPMVVQERVTIAYEDYPSLVAGQVQILPRLVDSDPFVFGDETHGMLCRLSTATLLNVTAGGGSTVPVFVVEPRGGTHE